MANVRKATNKDARSGRLFLNALYHLSTLTRVYGYRPRRLRACSYFLVDQQENSVLFSPSD